jgi:AcrR family transcriptional regulator
MRKRKPIKNNQTEKTTERIVNQAMKLFLEKGYHGTSIDDITQAAGLTKGALYWHFKSKEDLLKTIVKEFKKRSLEGMIHEVEGIKGGGLDKFVKMFRYNAAFAYFNRELCVSFTTLAAELVGAHHGIEPKIRQIYKKYQKFLSKLILQGQREKIFKKDLDHEVTALIIIAFHDGVLLQWSMNRDRVNGEVYAKTFQEIVLQGLMA